MKYPIKLLIWNICMCFLFAWLAIYATPTRFIVAVAYFNCIMFVICFCINNHFQWKTDRFNETFSNHVSLDSYTASIKTMNWRCMVCNKMRPDENIKVVTHDLSLHRGFTQNEIMKINVKHCNDNIDCFQDAHTIDKWIRWPLKEVK